MKILVFDTCFNKSYIVLREDNKILDSKIVYSDEKNYHSAFLIPELRNILIKNNIQIKNLDYIGINTGPGSFTGIRTGVTVARVLAQQANIELIGVESLKILSRINKTPKNTLVVTDARKNNVYTALYDSNNNEIIKPVLEAKDKILDYINNDTYVVTDSAINLYLKEKGIDSHNYEDNDNDIGLYLSDIVYEIINNNDENEYHWAKVKPLYPQRPSITKPKDINNV